MKNSLKELNRQNIKTASFEKTANAILEDVVDGLLNLYLAIEDYHHFFRDSELKGQKRIRESTEGERFKASVEKWISVVRERIDELETKTKTPFDVIVSARLTEEINMYSQNVNRIKNQILSKNSVEANDLVKPPENLEVYRKCLVYINLIKKLNAIIQKHNNYFEQLNQSEQIIDKIWNKFN
jgi:hypothetical protein